VLVVSCVAPREPAPAAAGAKAPDAAPGAAPTTEKSPTEKPTAENPTAEKPTAEKPTAEKPTAEKPAAVKPEEQEPEVWPTGKPKPAPPPAKVDAQDPEVWPTSQGKKDSTAPPGSVPALPASAPAPAAPHLPASAPVPQSSTSPLTGMPDATSAAGDSGFAIHGSLSSQYRGRWADSQHDNDLYEFLAMDFGDPNVNKWTAHVSARMSIDLDGTPPSSTPPLFFSLADTYDASVHTQLYEAHVDGTDIGPLAEIKLGRQIDYGTPAYAWFDGAYARSKPIGGTDLDVGAYGGIPVYLYESSRTGDVMAGAFAESKLWSESRGRLDWMHIEDNTSTGYHDDNMWSLGLWQDLGKSVHLEGNYTRLNDHNRDFGVRATWNRPEDELTVQASFYQLLEGQKDLALPIDPFFTSLGELFPYYDAQLLVSKALGPKFNLQAGLDVRRVTDDANLGEFNHDFERYFLTGVMSHVLPAELVLSATGEVWDAGSTGIAGGGVDLSRKFGIKWDTAIGTYYSLYKTDLFSAQERDNVRTYYLRLRYRQAEALSWDLRYEYESDDPGPFNSLILGLVWHF
jgi:hypothetical protein